MRRPDRAAGDYRAIEWHGYRGWYDMYADATFTEEDRALWPEATFNFRPESIDEDMARRYPTKD